MKPDVTAPGVDILAAFNTPAGSIGAPPEFNSISGTSMSGPHTAGAAALLRAVHPDWSPDEVRSALVTTGFTSLPGEGTEVHGVLEEDAATAADPFDLGGGRVELRRAARAGVVLDVSPAAYEDADPASGGDPTSLNLATLGNDACAGTCSWSRVVESSASGSVTWTTSAAGGGGLVLTVTPASFTLAPGQSQTITVTADASGIGSAWAFGRVLLDSSDASVPDAALPVAVRASGGGPVTPTLTLHFHGNAGLTGADHDSGHPGEGFCTGDGKTDLFACSGPMLLSSATLSPSPAASWKGGPAEWAFDGGNDRTIHDPNWIWCLRQDDPADPDEFQCPETEMPAPGETTLEGPMTVKWWTQCALTCVLGTNWDIRLWADGVRVLQQLVDAGPAPTGIPTLLTATVTVPRVTASHRITLQVEPVFLVDQAVEFTIFYDSTQPCGPASTGSCDSTVELPVVQEPRPDLVVSQAAASSSKGRTTVTATIANTGNADAGASQAEFLLDGTTVLGLVDTSAVRAGQSATVSVGWDTRRVRGEHEIRVTADKNGGVAESDEGNNAATLTVTVKGNKVTNGSFESSSNGTAPDNWSSSGETSYAPGGSDGERSVSADATGVWQSDAIDVQPGVGHSFSVDVSGAAGTVTIEQLSAAGTVVASLPIPFAASPVGIFETVTGALTIVDGAAQVRVRLAASLAGTATFDDVWLREQ